MYTCTTYMIIHVHVCTYMYMYIVHVCINLRFIIIKRPSFLCQSNTVETTALLKPHVSSFSAHVASQDKCTCTCIYIAHVLMYTCVRL